MPSPDPIGVVESPIERNGRLYRQHVDKVVTEVVLQIDREMRGKPEHMVYELLTARLAQRLPGIEMDDEAMRNAAAKIAIGLSPV